MSRPGALEGGSGSWMINNKEEKKRVNLGRSVTRIVAENFGHKAAAAVHCK